MENASNALIMAGGILIGILVLSLAVFLFVDFGQTSSDMHREQATHQLVEFNSKFTVYENREDLTIHDLVTVAGYALENNKYYGNDDNDKDYVDNYKITVNIYAKSNILNFQNELDKDYNKVLNDELIDDKMPIYRCLDIEYNSLGRVKLLKFGKVKV